jgi:glycosyltransferase involved in cell wall biosynthesis
MEQAFVSTESLNKTVWIINQYASTPATGMGGRHYYLARELAKRGYNVTVVAAGYHHLLREPPNLSAEIKEEALEGFRMVWLKVPKYERAQSIWRIWNWWLFSRRLNILKQALSDKPDTILYSSPGLLAFLGARKLARFFKARLVFEVRDIWPLTLQELGGYSKYHPGIAFLQWVEDKAYSDAECVVSNLKNSFQHMISRGMKPDKFSWVPNGFSLDEVNQSAPLPEQTLKSIPEKKFLVGYTGTLGVANDLDTLIEAASILRQEDSIAFVLVGNGQEKSRLQELARERKLNNVAFIDPVPKAQIQSMLAEFDVCHIGLTKDPLFRFGVSPNKLFDYLYSAKPIIYAIDSGEYHPIEDAGAGYEIEPHNPEVLAQTIMRLYKTSREERALMGERGRREALEHYEYQKLARKLAEVLFDGKAHND